LDARRACFFALVLLTLAPAARAQDDFGRIGPYLGLAGSLGVYTKEDDLVGDAGDIDPSIGLNARAGYRFHPHIALEGQFEWLSGADADVGGLGNIGELESWTATLNVKPYLLTGRVQPFLLVGVGAMQATLDPNFGSEQDETDFAARFGLGTDIYITRNLYAALDVSYVLPADDLEDFDYFSFGWGLGFRF
jgi:opacity protein-like surface antigen